MNHDIYDKMKSNIISSIISRAAWCKRGGRMLTVVAMLCGGVLTASAQDYDFYNEGLYYQRLAEGSTDVRLVAGVGIDADMTAIVVPATFTKQGVEYTVRAIGDNVCTGHAGITSVTLPSTLQSIGSSAFRDCVSLTRVTLGDGITAIGSNAFQGCTSLATISLPATLTAIGTAAFEGCTSLTAIALPDGLVTIGSQAFSGCSGLTGQLTVPYTVNSIYGNAFYATGYSSVTFQAAPAGYHPEVPAPDYYDDWASTNQGNHGTTSEHTYDITAAEGDIISFDWTVDSEGSCDVLTVNVGGTNILSESGTGKSGHIDYTCSTNASYLRVSYRKDGSVDSGTDTGTISNIVVTHSAPSTTLVLENNSFGSCPALHSLSMLRKQMAIQGTPFANTQIEQLSIGCTEVPRYFQGNSSLRSVEITGAVETVSSGAFAACERLTTAVVGAHRMDDEAFQNCLQLHELTLGNSVESLGDRVFEGCTSLTTAIVPPSVTEMGISVFANCTSLASAGLPASLSTIPAGTFSGCTGLSSLTVPEGIAALDADALRECSHLVSVELPASLTRIGARTFYGCSMLPSVVLPEGIEELPEEALRGCSALTSVVLPSTLTTIGSNALTDCGALTVITLPERVQSIAPDAFGGDSFAQIYSLNPTPADITGGNPFAAFLTRATLYVPAEAVSSYRETHYWEEFRRIEQLEMMPAAQPTFSYSNFTLAISTLTEDAFIYYTTDGSEPVVPSVLPDAGEGGGSEDGGDSDAGTRLYTGPIDFVANGTVRAVAVKTGMAASGVSVFDKQDFQVATPQVSIDPATLYVSIAVEHPDERLAVAEVYYDIRYDGSWPDELTTEEQIREAGALYTEPFRPEGPAYLRVYALRDGWLRATCVSFNAYSNYRLDAPVINWDGTNLTFSHNDGAVAIYYTLDGSDPCDSETRVLYDGETVVPDRNLQVRAVAEREAHFPSTVSEHTITDVHSTMNVDGYLYRKVDYSSGNVVELTGGKTYSGDINIPATITYGGVDYTVVRIGYRAFYDCDALGTVTIPGTVTSIGGEAFLYVDNLASIDIPASVEEIEANAFYECYNLSSITLHEGLRRIGNYAFYNTSLVNVQLPSTVTSIGSYAFSYSQSLQHINLPDGLAEVGNHTFYNCTALQELTVPPSLTRLPDNFVDLCISLRSITLPETLTEIGEWAMSSLYALQEVTIPTSVRTLKRGFLAYGRSLGSVTLPEGITSIPPEGLCNSSALVSVSLPGTLTFIGDNAFNSDPMLASITIPASVTTVDGNAFSNCTRLTDVYCYAETPPSTSASYNPFYNTPSSKNLYVPEASIEAYGAAAVWQGFNIQAISDVPAAQPTFVLNDYMLAISTTTPDATIYYTTDPEAEVTTESTRYTGPIDFVANGTVRAIAVAEGFAQSPVGTYTYNSYKVATPEVSVADDLTVTLSVATPKETVADAAIYYAMSASSYWPNYLDGDIDWVKQNYKLYTEPFRPTHPGIMIAYAIRDNWIMSDRRNVDLYTDYHLAQPTIDFDDETGTVTIAHEDAEATVYYTIDGTDPLTSETRMEYTDAFVINRNLLIRAVAERPEHFPSDERQNNITSINSTFIADDIYYRIPDGMLGNVLELTSNPSKYSGDITIPATVTRDGVEYTVVRIGNSAFYDCDALGTVTLPNTITTIGSEAFAGCQNFASIDIPASVKTIEDRAFEDCHQLETVTFHEGLESIGDWAFSGCFQLTTLTLPDGVVSIGDRCFQSCTSMASMSLSASLTTIGQAAFRDCDALTDVVLPSGLTTISAELFYTCDQLRSVQIPATVTSMGNFPFYNCPRLTSIVIPEGVTSISAQAFESCYELVSVTLPSTITRIERYAFHNCTKLQSITLPAALEFIGEYAFTSCPVLNDIYALGTTPASFYGGYNPFSDMMSRATLHVPEEAVETYQTATFWQNFSSIVAADNMPAAQPTFSYSDYTLTLASTTEGASFRYTMDGSVPTAESTLYNDHIDLTGNVTIKAIALADGFSASPVATYNHPTAADFKVATPEHVIGDDLSVTLTVSKPKETIADAVIYYSMTTNSGDWPATYYTRGEVEQNCTLYTEPLHPTRPGMMRVYAFRDDWQNADRLDIDLYSAYRLDAPQIDWDGATRTITVGANYEEGSGSVFYYTLDGTDPTTSETRIRYEAPFLLERNTAVRAVATMDGHFDSDVWGIEIRDLDYAFEHEGLYYKLRDYTTDNIVSVVAARDDNGYSGAIVIPATIEHGGHTCIVSSVAANAFNGSAITGLTLGSNLTEIGESAFRDTHSLTGTLTIPGNVSSIASNAFNTTGLQAIVMTSSPLDNEEVSEASTLRLEDWESDNHSHNSTSNHVYTFDAVAGAGIQFDYYVSSEGGCDWLTIQLDGTQVVRVAGSASDTYVGTLTTAGSHTITVSYSKDGSVSNGEDLGRIYNIMIGEAVVRPGLLTVGASAFYGNNQLVSVNIQRRRLNMGGVAFAGAHITTATLNAENVGSWLYGQTDLRNLTFGARVRSIGASAFNDCSGLLALQLPDGVTSIGNNAFSGCFGIVSIVMPSTLTSIGTNAFAGLTALPTLTLPASLAEIGQDAFSGCTALTAVYANPTTPPAMTGGTAFPTAASVNLYVPEEAANAYQAAQYWNEFASLHDLDNIPCETPVLAYDNFTVAMTSATAGAHIYYTTDGSDPSDPTSPRTLYEAPVDFLRNQTLRAVALADGFGPSAIAEYSRTDFQVENPVAAINDATLVMTISSEKADERLANAEYYYSIGGRIGEEGTLYISEASEAELRQYATLYTEPVQLTAPGWVYVVALRDGWIKSEMRQFNFQDDYYLSEPDIYVDENHLVHIGENYPDEDTEVSFRYTLDGSDPTPESTLYEGSFLVTQNHTIRAIAVKPAHFNSDVRSLVMEHYRVATPVVNFDADTYTLTISSDNPYDQDTRYYYTVSYQPTWPEMRADEAWLCENATLYTEPVTLDRPQYICAIAMRDGWIASEQTWNDLWDDYVTAAPSIRYESVNNVTTVYIGENFDIESGTTFRYTLDGSTPTAESTRYEGSFTLPRNLVVKAIAMQPRHFNSAVATQAVTGVYSTFAYKGIYYRYTDNSVAGEVEVTHEGDIKYAGDIVIPQTLEHKGSVCAVVGVGESAFAECPELTSVTLPSAIRYIEARAFSGCSAMTGDWTLPAATTRVGESAFAGTGITSLTIPAATTEIAQSAFDSAPITRLTIEAEPEDTEVGRDDEGNILPHLTVRDYAFNQCWSLGEVVIERRDVSIADYAFSNCDNIEVARVNSRTITRYLADHDHLTTVALGDNVETIGPGAYYSAGALRDITFGSRVRAISGSAFADCNSLQAVVLPESVETMGESVFQYSRNLQSIVMPRQMQSIGSNAFYACERLQSIVVPEGITVLASGIFDDCYCLSSVSLPSTLQRIGERAFNTCRSLQALTLPQALTNIDAEAFTECAALAEIYALPLQAPSLSGNPFSGLTDRVKLYVHESAYDSYSSVPVWMLFNSNMETFTDLPAAQPTFFFSDYALTITTQTPGAVIYYTTDGTDPDPADAYSYDGPVVFDRNMQVRAIAVAEGYSASAIAVYKRTDFKVATPAISITDDLVLTITTEQPVEVPTHIYYVMSEEWWPATYDDEADIVAHGTLYEGPIQLTRPGYVRCVVLRDDWAQSEWSGAEYQVGDRWRRVATPQISFSQITATITCEEEVDAIYYTFAGDVEPTRESTLYTGPFDMARDSYVRAIAVRRGLFDSESRAVWFSAADHTCRQPSFAGAVSRATTDSLVTIATATEDAIIYYTLDGSEPTTQSTVYTEPVKVEHNMVIRAIAVKQDMINSPISQANITWVTLHTPVIAAFDETVYCSITQDKPGSTIYYAIVDGSNVSVEPQTDDWNVYTDAFQMPRKASVVWTYAAMDDYNNSAIAKRTFEPNLNLVCGTPSISRITGTDRVRITTTTADADIYYTIDGDEPTEGSLLYDKEQNYVTVESNVTVRAVAINRHYYNSEVKDFAVTWFKVARPVITTEGIYVTIATTTPEARIYYTLDGTTPTNESTPYDGTFTMTGDATIQAIALRDEFNNSDVATFNYQVSAHSCGTPAFRREGGGIDGNIVAIEATPVAEQTSIYYTIDGSDPLESGILYTEPIVMTHNCTLRAVAVNPGYFNSPEGQMTVDWFRVSPPDFAYEGHVLTITCSTEGDDVVIYYRYLTPEGTAINDPQPYTGPLTLVNNRTVAAYAEKPDFNTSDEVQFSHSDFICTEVTFAYNGRYVTMEANDGSTIYYTLDRSTPNSQSDVYTEPVEITELCTVTAVATKRYFNDAPAATYAVKYLFDGERVSTGEAGHLDEVFEWRGGADDIETLPVTGSVNAADISYIKGMRSLRHLDMTGATIAEGSLPDRAFEGMQLVSYSSPQQSQAISVGEHVFAGCKQLAAIVWNITDNMPAQMLDDVDNDNFLVYVPSRIYAPASYTGNLISGSEAESIVLHDSETGGNFYCPRRFFARSISYTHTYSQATEPSVTMGWETLALPFDVASITHATNGAMKPFAADADVTEFRPFWLYELAETGFVRAAEIEAYKPYIISMPNNAKYADHFNLAGEVTFAGAADGVWVEADQADATTKGSITFLPTMMQVPQAANILALNVDKALHPEEADMPELTGSAFVAGLRDVHPFQAYALAEANAPSMVMLSDMLTREATAVRDVEMRMLLDFGARRGVYDVSGRKMADDESFFSTHPNAKGVFIVNGEKRIVH